MGEWKEYHNAPAFGTPSLFKEGVGGVLILNGRVSADVERAG
jgi:hypothetical protein